MSAISKLLQSNVVLVLDNVRKIYPTYSDRDCSSDRRYQTGSPSNYSAQDIEGSR